MGFFSFTYADLPADAGGADWTRSMWNVHSGMQPASGWLLVPGGPNIFEPCYDGYGVMGGRDVFVHWMAINGLVPAPPHDEDDLADYQERHRQRFFQLPESEGFWAQLAGMPTVRPLLPLRIATIDIEYESCPGVSLDCPYQGFFATPQMRRAAAARGRAADPLLGPEAPDAPFPQGLVR